MQPKTSTKIFQYLAGFASIYHLMLGLIGIFGTTNFIVIVVNKVYGVIPTVNAQFLYLAKFISVYFIVFAVAMAILA
mgnify:FL=1